MIDIDCSIFVARVFFSYSLFFFFLVHLLHFSRFHCSFARAIVIAFDAMAYFGCWFAHQQECHPIQVNANDSMCDGDEIPKIDPYNRFHEQETTQQFIWILSMRVEFR